MFWLGVAKCLDAALALKVAQRGGGGGGGGGCTPTHFP